MITRNGTISHDVHSWRNNCGTPFFQAREDINLDAEECALTYEVERKPLKAKTEAPKGTLRFGGFYANSAGWSGMGTLSGDETAFSPPISSFALSLAKRLHFWELREIFLSLKLSFPLGTISD